MGHTQIEQIALIADAIRMHHVKFSNSKWWSDLVLDDLCPHPLTNHLFTIFELTNASNIDSTRAVKLQRSAAGRRLRTAEHNANFFPDLVDKDCTSLTSIDRPGQLPH